MPTRKDYKQVIERNLGSKGRENQEEEKGAVEGGTSIGEHNVRTKEKQTESY